MTRDTLTFSKTPVYNPVNRIDMRAVIYHRVTHRSLPFGVVMDCLKNVICKRPQLYAINGRPC